MISNKNKFWRYDNREVLNIIDAIENGFSNKWNKLLEEEFSRKMGVEYCIGVNSGTSALHIALLAAGVRPGDEVIVPPLTFAAPCLAVVLAGAKPIFADVNRDTFNIDIKSIRNLITPQTKAVIAVSLYGLPNDIDAIMEIGKQNNFKVIEDNAECVLGKYPDGKYVGSKADISIFSFQKSKHITAETGGILVTNDKTLAKEARKYSIMGYRTLEAKSGEKTVSIEEVQNPNFIRHDFFAPNYRLPELCAAAMVAQLEKLDEFVANRILIAKEFDSVIRGCKWLSPQYNPEGFVNTYWTYAVRIHLENLSFTWQDFNLKFREFGGDSFYAAWLVNYLEPAFDYHYGAQSEYKKGLCPVAEQIQPQIIQFKTNMRTKESISKEMDALKQTIHFFNKNYV